MNLPNGWKYTKLSELFDEVSEKNHPDADVLTIIQGVGTVLRTDSGRDILYDKNSLSNYKFVKKGDFIIHLRSFEGGLEIANQDGIVSPAYIILRPKLPTATTYLYTVFHSNRFINQTMAPAVEGVRDGRSVKYEVLKERSIPFPPLAEQQKIAQILTKQDEVISLKEILLEQKQQQKRWLMQKLLEVPHENTKCVKTFSIDGIPINKNEWEKEKLGKLLEFKNGINTDKEKYGFGTKMISVRDILSEHPIVYDSIKNAVNLAPNELNTYAVNYGDILFQRSSENYEEAGSSNVYLDKNTNATFSGFVICGKKISEYEPLCLNAILKTKFVRHQIIKSSAGAQHINIGQGSLCKIIIYLPTLPEQKIIAQVLSAADKEIDLLKQEIEFQKQKKKALAQQLLSGKVRVKT